MTMDREWRSQTFFRQKGGENCFLSLHPLKRRSVDDMGGRNNATNLMYIEQFKEAAVWMVLKSLFNWVQILIWPSRKCA